MPCPFVLSSRSIGSNTDILTILNHFMLWFVYFLAGLKLSWLISAAFALSHRSRSVKQGGRVVVLLTIQNGHFAVVATSWNRWTYLREFLVLSPSVICL